MDHDRDLAVAESPPLRDGAIVLGNAQGLNFDKMIAVAQRAKLTMSPVPHRHRDAIQFSLVESEPAALDMGQGSRFSRRVRVRHVLARQTVKSFAQHVLQTNVGEVPSRMIFHRDTFLDGFDQLSTELDVLQVLRLQIRQMHAHPAADVAADDGGGDEAVLYAPHRRRADAGADSDMGVGRIAHIPNIRNLQVVVRHLEHLGPHGIEQIVVREYVEIPGREIDSPIIKFVNILFHK